MARRFYDLPPLTTLAAFETAARNLSFKDASTELNVTPGAVSHQIKALEGDLGVALFKRKHRGVALTDNGILLFHALERSFSEIAKTLSRLRKSGDDVSVSVASTTAVSSLWLTPRLSQFWRVNAEVPVNQFVSDYGPRHSENPDLFIQYGKPSDPDKVYSELFRDQLVPVCSPEVAQKLTHTSLDNLSQQTLIHLEADDTSWTTWETWFKELGHTERISTSGYKVNSYMIALQAAQDGAGIVLGWQRLVRPLLEKNLLIPLGPNTLRAPNSFYIVSDPDETISPNARLLKTWLLQNI